VIIFQRSHLLNYNRLLYNICFMKLLFSVSLDSKVITLSCFHCPSFSDCIVRLVICLLQSTTTLFVRLFLSVRPSIRPSVHMSVCPSIYMPVCQSIHMSVFRSVCPSVCPSICPSVCFSFFLSICKFVPVNPFVNLFIRPL